MSLADELLADLEGLEDGDDSDLEALEEEDEGEEENQLQKDLTVIQSGSDISEVAKLANSEELREVLASIDKFNAEGAGKGVLGPVEEDPEYKLIVQSNNLLLAVDQEITVIHQWVKDHYGRRFPELQQLVQHPLDYMRTVKMMQNQMDTTQLNLASLLPPATIIVVSVSADSTKGAMLGERELAQVIEACEMGLSLNAAKLKILQYVESRMDFLAPNTTHICGAGTAAKLLGVAGGLTALSKMPACNVLLLGSMKRATAGFSAAAMLPHTGFLYFCQVVQEQPPEYRKKAARLISGKVALAARVDSYQSEGQQGPTVAISMLKDVKRKLEKAQEPPPGRLEKSLPKPDLEFKKKRGGKKFRKAKERQQTSDAWKAANRMGFGEIQEDLFQDDMGSTLGSLGKSNGRFRIQETKSVAKGGTISKKMKKRLAQQQQERNGTLTMIGRGGGSGTASVAFTPLQGLEIQVAKNKKRKVDGKTQYFGRSSFHNVKERK